MRVITCAFLFFMLLSFTPAQEKDRWQTILSTDDATVGMNVSTVIFGTDYTGRVQFRITLSKPAPVAGKEGVRYKTVIETMEFRCPDRLYRVIDVKRFDSKGNQIDSNEAKPSVEWIPVKSSGLMSKMFTQGCELIYKKKSNP